MASTGGCQLLVIGGDGIAAAAVAAYLSAAAEVSLLSGRDRKKGGKEE